MTNRNSAWRRIGQYGQIALYCSLFAAVPAAAQSDGSLERLYKSQCVGKKHTDACRTLATAISKSRPAANARPEGQSGSAEPRNSDFARIWGPMANLDGTVWKQPLDGTVFRYKWSLPGEILLAETAGPYGFGTVKYQRTADDRIVGTDNRGDVHRISVPRENIIVTEVPARFRAMYRYTGDRVIGTWQEFKAGKFEPEMPLERLRVGSDAFEAASRQAREYEAGLASVWGGVAKFLGF